MMMWMRFLAIFVVLAPLSSLGSATKAVVVGYFSKEPAAVFESRIKPFFEEQVRKRCSDCQIRNLTPFLPSGEVDEPSLRILVSSLPSDVSFLFFDWNERAQGSHADLILALSKASGEGMVIVASAGVPVVPDGTCPLTQTLFGKVPGAIILGELEERDRLRAQCYYGPEMLTAVRPPKAVLGQGLGPTYFVAQLASHWNRRDSNEWVGYLKARKAKTKKIWAEMEEFFPR